MAAEGNEIPKNAFLIVNGSEIFPLRKKVVNIGRMDDNDIIIQNAHVSRYHARLMAADGKYTLLDLESTGGTSVNGKRVSRAPIKPGDVITLSGVPLIYGRSKGAAKLESAHRPAPGQKPNMPNKKGTTESLDVSSINRFLEMFDSPEGEEEEG
jgi:pSer/pThr/pTyr-binding forkhead associated (FHA) protein